MQNKQTKILVKSLYLINLLLTLVISFLIAFSTNIKLLVFSQEVQTQSLLVYILVSLMILSAFYFVINLSANNIIVFFIILFISVPLTVTAIQILQWFIVTIEGPIHFRFFTLIKTATFEIKLQEYIKCVAQYILLLSKDNLPLEDYLNNITSLKNPSTSLIIKTTFYDIANLAQTHVKEAIMDYHTLKNNSAITPGFFKRNLKPIIITTSIICTVLIGWYILSITWNNISSLETTTTNIQKLVETSPEFQNTVASVHNLQKDLDAYHEVMQTFIDTVNTKASTLSMLVRNNLKITTALNEKQKAIEVELTGSILESVRFTCDFISRVFVPHVLESSSLENKDLIFRLINQLATENPIIAKYLNIKL